MTTATITQERSAFGMLGADVSTLTDLDDILAAADAAWNAVPFVNSSDTPIGRKESASISLRRDDNYAEVGVHKPSYTDIQYRAVAEIALEAVGLRPQDSGITFAGTLNKGEMFFINIDLGKLFIDPNGINDEVTRHLTAMASHNGRIPVILTPEFLRVICQNMLPAIRKSAKRADAFMAKHTKNALNKLALAKEALGIADAAHQLFVQQAEAMLATPANKDTVVRFADKLWVPSATMTERAKTISDNRKATLARLWSDPKNEPAVGSNMYAVYQTFTEYFDHGRGTSPEKRAIATLLPGTSIQTQKAGVLSLCLN